LRKLVFAAFFFLVIGEVAGLGFGAYPVQIEKQTDSYSSVFSLGVVNPGNDTVNVTFGTEESDIYNVSFEDNPVQVEPGEVTRSPEGSGWYSLGDGRYVERSEIDFRVDVQKFQNRIDIPITVRATPSETPEKGGEVIYVQEYNFRLFPSEVLKPEGDKERSKGEIWKIEEESEADERGENTNSEGVNLSETYKFDPEEKQDGGEEGDINLVTMILLTGIAAMSFYLLKVS